MNNYYQPGVQVYAPSPSPAPQFNSNYQNLGVYYNDPNLLPANNQVNIQINNNFPQPRPSVPQGPPQNTQFPQAYPQYVQNPPQYTQNPPQYTQNPPQAAPQYTHVNFQYPQIIHQQLSPVYVQIPAQPPQFVQVPAPNPTVIINNNQGCSNCGRTMTTRKYIGPGAWGLFILLLCICPLFSFLPFIIESCQDEEIICHGCVHQTYQI